MEERAACALLKSRFEAAGLVIAENLWFEGAGVVFEIDGYDAARRVGYEYVTEEAGDSWDVDDSVAARLAAARTAGEYFILIVSEHEAPDAAALEARADAFLAALPGSEPVPAANELAAKKQPAAKKPAAKKPAAKKPAAKKPAAKKPAAKKPSAKKPSAKKPSAKKPAAKKHPAAKKSRG